MSRIRVGLAPVGIILIATPILAADPKPVPGDQIFAGSKVLAFHLAMTEKQFAALAPASPPGFGGPGFGPARKPAEGTHRNTFGVDFPWSHGDLMYDGQTLTSVGVRYKGNYTYMATTRSLKKSLKIDVNRVLDTQKLDGLTMFNFHCGVSDPTKSREAFSYAYFRSAGVPAPRTTFAELTLTVPTKFNQELVGLYTVVEQVNKPFLKRHFGDGKGMLLKPEGLPGGLLHLGSNWKAYEDRYQPNDPPTDAQKQRLIEFTKLIATGTDEEFAREIGSYLDIEAFLKFLAANALLANLDSFLGYGHNYYLYLIPGKNQFVFIPWDLDLSLATWPAAGTPEQQVELSIHHPHAGKNGLIDRLLAIQAHKDRYLTLIREQVATVFCRPKLLEILNTIEQQVKDPIAREAKAVANRKEGGGPGFGGGQFGWSMPPRRFIEKRTASVLDQLEGKSNGYDPKPIGFGFGPPPGGPKKK